MFYILLALIAIGILLLSRPGQMLLGIIVIGSLILLILAIIGILLLLGIPFAYDNKNFILWIIAGILWIPMVIVVLRNVLERRRKS